MNSNQNKNIRDFLIQNRKAKKFRAIQLRLFLLLIVLICFSVMLYVFANYVMTFDYGPNKFIKIIVTLILLLVSFGAIYSIFAAPIEDLRNAFFLKFLFKENIQDNKDVFYCYHCYKGILTEEIAPISCTVCHTENNFLDLVDECTRCENPLLYFKCPFCNETMDFINAEYNPEVIRKNLHGQG